MSFPSDREPFDRQPSRDVQNPNHPPASDDSSEPGANQQQSANEKKEYDPKVGFAIPSSPTKPAESRAVDANRLVDRYDEKMFEDEPLFGNFFLALFVAPLIALIGGACSTAAAFVMNTMYSLELGLFSYFAAVLIAPWVEELLKPIGVYLLLWKWPNVFKLRIYNALLAGIAGLVFATLENLLYIHLFYPEMNVETAQFRWVYCTALHVTCSTIFGYGLSPERVKLAWDGGENSSWTSLYIPAILAILIHGLWNLVATIQGILELF